MMLDDLLDDRQTGAISFIFLPRIQSLEYLEDLLMILRLDSDSIVPDKKLNEVRLVFLPVHSDENILLIVELDSVAQQVEEDLLYAGFISINNRKIGWDLELDVLACDSEGEILTNIVQHLIDVDGFGRLSDASDAGKVEQRIDKRAKTFAEIDER